MSSSITQFTHLQIPLKEILNATNNFCEQNIIGKGGFGNVYKGQLLRSGALIDISARRLDHNQGQGDVEFWTEISVLSSLEHPNIVSLIGFCDEKGEKIIINRHEAKGSLGMYLSDPELTWIQRVRISVGVARAISYLHYEEGRNYSIVHRNINSSTILLDDNFEAKLSGFEFSIKDSTDRMERYIPSEVIGTQGYMDPDSIKSGDVTQKSDIYSFGVVLLEMMSGRKAFLPYESEDKKLLVLLVMFHARRGAVRDVAHLAWDQAPLDSFRMFLGTAFKCIRDKGQDRPTMNEVLFSLNRTLEQEDLRKKRHLLQDIYNVKRMIDGLSVRLRNFVGASFNHLARCIKTDPGAKTESTSSKVKKFEHLRIRFMDIRLATNSFSTESTLANTESYSVYKGDLECFNREYVSSLEDKSKGELPKRRYKNVRIMCIKNANAEAMFHTEIEVLSTCKHNNIVSLLGFCDESHHMILVYEGNNLNQSLRECLTTFPWEFRVRFCVNIALGLNYIHNEMEDQKVLIHRQISSNTILLDDEHMMRISGFGLSTFLSSNQDEDTGPLRKNLLDPTSDFYMAPEYRETGKATKESDIYSFGIVMFEIVSGLPYSLLSQHSFNYRTIKQKVDQAIKTENYDNKLFLKKGPNEDSLDTFIKITEQCLAVNRKQRPTLKVIIMELQKALRFQEYHELYLRIPFKDIESATQKFSCANDIGGGGFGRVYIGELVSDHRSSTIVAKRLDKRGGQGDQQFYNELHILSEYKHENVIGLVGYNNEEQERIVVYEYASRGSLDKYLNDTSLTWISRLNICIDVARGLAFLHGGVREHEAVIHRDMKTANILLFDDWKAKVADFGLSLICTTSDETDYVIDYACGTPGYLDPVYQKSRFLTKKSDIYSLGVVLFEILYGKSTYEINKRENQFLHSLVKQRLEEGRLDEVVFNAIKNQIVPEALATFQAIGYQCLHDDREKRPTAQHVLIQLQKALEFQVKDVPVSEIKNLDIC